MTVFNIEVYNQRQLAGSFFCPLSTHLEQMSIFSEQNVGEVLSLVRVLANQISNNPSKRRILRHLSRTKKKNVTRRLIGIFHWHKETLFEGRRLTSAVGAENFHKDDGFGFIVQVGVLSNFECGCTVDCQVCWTQHEVVWSVDHITEDRLISIIVNDSYPDD